MARWEEVAAAWTQVALSSFVRATTDPQRLQGRLAAEE